MITQLFHSGPPPTAAIETSRPPSSPKSNLVLPGCEFAQGQDLPADSTRTFDHPHGCKLARQKKSVPPTTSDCKLARKRLAELCEHGQYQELELYAASRLRLVGVHSSSGLDLVHSAVRSVLIGMRGGKGRCPKSENLKDARSFAIYLQQVIKSQAEFTGRRGRFLKLVDLDQIADCGGNYVSHYEPAAAARPDQDPELKDLKRALFIRLRQQAPARFRSLIRSWKREFIWSDEIPLRGVHRQYRAELRQLACRILLELEPELWPKLPPANDGAATREDHCQPDLAGNWRRCQHSDTVQREGRNCL